MPKLNFLKEGRGPTIVLSHALGSDLSMWDEVAARLALEFTVLRFDHRGHGGSEAVAGSCTIEDLAGDAAQLIERETEGSAHFVGLSMGGMVAQQIAVQYPQLVASIVVANSSSRYDETSRGMWRSRQETALNLGMAPIANSVVPRWFTRGYRENAMGVERMRCLQGVLESTDPKTYAACCNAVSSIDFSATNPLIGCPTLVIAGSHDEVHPLAMSEGICNTISGAELAMLEAGHLSAVERPDEFAGLVGDFVKRI